MDELLHRALAERITAYLDAVDHLAAEHPHSAAFETRRLTAAWRALLRRHRPTAPRSRCTGCGRVHSMRRHPNAQMCTVWHVATAYFIRRLPGD